MIEPLNPTWQEKAALSVMIYAGTSGILLLDCNVRLNRTITRVRRHEDNSNVMAHPGGPDVSG